MALLREECVMESGVFLPFAKFNINNKSCPESVVISWLKTDSSPLGGGTSKTTEALPGTAEISKILAQAQDTGIGQN